MNLPQEEQRKTSPLSNTLTYHRWLVGMECRKDILNQNQVINKKIVKKATPLLTRLQAQAKNNRMRIIYMAGLCGFFSLDKLYDMIILDNTYIKACKKRALLLFSHKSGIRREQEEIRTALNSVGLGESKLSGFGKLFLQLDQRFVLDRAFMQRIADRTTPYNKDEVDLASFVQFFKAEELEQIISRLRGEFPSLHLHI